MIDSSRFSNALARVSAEEELSTGIGTLSERSIHKVLKLYYEPNTDNHEIEVSGSVADILNSDGITEIQRANFSYLVPKLRRFLPEYNVTLVYPIIGRKNLSWLNPMTGELTEKRRCPGGKTVYDTAYELYKIRDFLGDSRLTVKVVILECDVYKKLDGYGKDRKKHASLIESKPRRIIEEITLKSASDYRIFLPDGLGGDFTAEDFHRAAKSRSRYSYYSIRLLEHLGFVARCGSKGRAFLYTLLPTENK